VLAALIAAIGTGFANTHDDTAAVQSAVDKGGTVTFAPRTYYLSKTIIVRRSNTVIRGSGPRTVFRYRASKVLENCVNDRVFMTACDAIEWPPRPIAGAISIGEREFRAAGDLSDLEPGDWLIITERDQAIGDVVSVDWVRVASVFGDVVHLEAPFRTALTTARPWIPARSGLGFQRVGRLVENVEFRDFRIVVPEAGAGAAAVGISVYGALHTTIDHVSVESFAAQPLYSYLSKGLTVTASEGRGHGVLNEFAATVDLTVRDSRFSEYHAAALGLNLGTAFFEVSGNHVGASRNIGVYLMHGVHDGSFTGNRIAFVRSSGDAYGILAWGTQNVAITGNQLEGGDGVGSTAISVRDSDAGEVLIPSSKTELAVNTFGRGWARNYERGDIR